MNDIGRQPARGPSPPPSPVVDTALRQLDRLLDASGLGWVSRDEVRQATQLIGALPAHDADAVVDRMAATGRLDRLAQEVMDRSWVGPGLTADQRADFFQAMAQDLDGDSLAALSQSLAGTEAASGGFEPVTELGTAVARHAPPQARLAYVQALAGRTTDKPQHAVGGLLEFDGQRRLGDAEARAIASVVASFGDDAASARAAFETLAREPGALDAVMLAATDTEQDWGLINGWHTAKSDHGTFRTLMQTAARMEQSFAGGADGATVRALGDRVFDAAVRAVAPGDVQAADLVFRATPMDAHATRMAELSQAVYDRSSAPAGATRLDDAQLQALGLDPALLHKPAIGFEAALFRLDDGGWVLAFRGTDDWALARAGDADDNLAQGLGLGSLQHSAAAIAAMEVARVVPAGRLETTGHSLGGGLAATAAGRAGVPATTFNAAGVADETREGYSLHFADGQVTNYRTTGDIMSFLNGGPVPTRYADALGLDRLRQFPASVGRSVDLGNPLARVYLGARLDSWNPGTIAEGGRFGTQQHGLAEVLRHRAPAP
ncbi:hypothetical protein CLD22_22355 [Rubrivivax gelatinosus]|nr:hypothetical protein [Rubrivivax gelatinosus]